MRRTAGWRRHPAGADGAGAAPRDRARSALLRTGVPVALVLALVAGGTLTSRAAIDPNQVTRLTPQGLARGDQFGFSVALSGTTLAVGSPRDDDDAGRVTIFERGSGAWVEVATVLPQGGAPGSQFGYAVDLDGSTLAVGAARADGDRGAVYVFTRDSSGAWSQQARLGGVNPGDELGYAVALEGDTLAAGAPFAAGAGGAERGALTVYERSGGSWSEAASVLGLDTGPGDRFGNAASLSGSTLLVGAAHARQDGNASTGAAYVFVRGAGGWGQQAKLVDSQPAAFDKLGRAVALDGDVALVGVPHDDDVATDGGAALVFLRTGTSWAQQAKLAPGDLVSGAYFGRALVLSGTTALVGSPFATSGGSAQAGAAYTFTSSGGQWTQQARFAAAPPSASAEYGRSLALEGDTAVVGEPEVNGYRGAAHVYEATTAPPTTSPSTTSPSTTAPPTTAPPTTAPPTTAPPTTAPPTTGHPTTTAPPTTAPPTTAPPTTAPPTTAPPAGGPVVIDPEVRYTGGSSTVTGSIDCPTPSDYTLRVTLTQNGYRLSGRARGDCTGSASSFTVVVDGTMVAGPAQACATARLGQGPDPDRVCATVTVVTG